MQHQRTMHLPMRLRVTAVSRQLHLMLVLSANQPGRKLQLQPLPPRARIRWQQMTVSHQLQLMLLMPVSQATSGLHLQHRLQQMGSPRQQTMCLTKTQQVWIDHRQIPPGQHWIRLRLQTTMPSQRLSQPSRMKPFSCRPRLRQQSKMHEFSGRW